MSQIARIAVAAMLTGACASAARAQDDAFVGFVSPVASQPGQAMAAEIMEKMAADMGWRYRTLDANNSPDRQVSHVDTLVTLGADAITSWSIDPNAVAAAYARANAEGVGIVGINSTGEGINATVWWQIVLCDEGGAFDQQVAWIKERRPKAKIIVMGGPPVPSIQSMTQCFQEKAEAAGLEVLTRVDNTNDSIASGASLGSDLLVRYPDVNVFWAYNDASALGISASVLAAGKSVYAADGSEGIMIFGINGDDEAIAALREGRITATWDPDVYAMAAGAMRAMKNVMEQPGEKLDDIVLKSLYLTYDNIDEYVPTLERGYTVETVPLVE